LLKVELNTINQTKPINSIIKDKTSEFYTWPIMVIWIWFYTKNQNIWSVIQSNLH
jgi:hypothetical protein